ncbi:MAG TPA: proton-conducting transporter membrane subunit [Thermoguttaceae bacterium]|nr:proton-conducting transporter membrane subunit [Thermoguttaceae bacterium]
MLTTETLWYLGPEATLVLTAVVLYLRGVFRRWEDQPIAAGKSLSQDTLSLQIALVGVVLAGWALVRIGLPQESVGPVILDPLGLYIRWLSLAAIGLLVLLASTDASRTNRPEYLGTVLLAGAGVMAVAAADNLVLLFVALELVSIPTYIVLCLGRRDADGYEASAKYFFLSLAASAMTLYGISFLYGASGSLELTAIRQNLVGKLSVSEGYFSDFTQLGVIFLLAGLGFKITAAPFHFYAPDVYQGTSYPNAALLSAAPKIAGFTALVRILIESYGRGNNMVSAGGWCWPWRS